MDTNARISIYKTFTYFFVANIGKQQIIFLFGIIDNESTFTTIKVNLSGRLILIF